jgi:uncharacterized membrane protein YphA (DoxX/SURF4 family)
MNSPTVIMASIRRLYERLDTSVSRWMAREGVIFLRVSLGIVFLWFGALKFFPHVSPAQELATRTMDALTLGKVPPAVTLPVLAALECLIGIGLLSGILMRVTLLLMFVQMVGTVTPMFLFPNELFLRSPYAPTLEGQYIIKNLVLISAGVVIGATVRGGKLVADPQRIRRASPGA